MLKKLAQWIGELGHAGVVREPCARLCLFGKHPGWADHLDDLGLTTQRLVELRRRLYSEGIATNIDSGAWERLGAGRAQASFDHDLVWRFGPDEYVLARLIASRDARGRDKYPLVGAAHAVSVSPRRLIAEGIGVLADLLDQARATDDASSVRAIFERAASSVQARWLAAGQAPGEERGAGGLDPALLGALAADDVLNDPSSPALARVAHQVVAETRRIAGNADRSVQVRVPALTNAERGRSAWAWLAGVRELLAPELRDRLPLLAIESTRERVVDVIIGRVSAGELVCLRATRAAMPCTTDVPYSLDPALEASTRSLLAGWKSLNVGVSSAPGSASSGMHA